jgi:hypothetical protein
VSKTYVSSSSSGGIGVAGLLGVAFVVLKLTGVIAWPWLWVLAPFWIPIAFAILLLVLFGIGMLLALAVGK